MTPLEYVKQDVLQCAWDPAPYLLFSGEVEPLVYYSHLFPAVAVLILAIVVLRRSGHLLTSKLFFAIGVLFSMFATFDLILWATEQPSLIMFLWSILTYIEPLIYAFTVYLVLVLVNQRDLSLYTKIVAGILLLPVILLGPTALNLSGFDYTNCWRLAIEGPLLMYVYLIEIIFVCWMMVGTYLANRQQTDAQLRARSWYLLIGAILFLVAFSSGNIFGTLLQGVMGEEAWVIGQYGLFGMPVFLGFIMYLMVRFQIFSARVLYAEALMFGLFIAILSLLFVPDIHTARPIIAITMLLVGVLGYFLVSGIRKDIEQKEHIEKLAQKLEKANKRLKVLDQLKSEFVSIASHQLRSPLTSVRGYASMLLEGSYGKLSDKARDAVERIAESSRMMALSVEDYLNVSRIQAGNMKYVYSDFNVADMASQIVDDIRRDAMKKGLVLSYKSDLDQKGVVHADKGKTMQIIHNLVNNAIRYTPQGTVKVYAHNDKKQIHIDVIDSGIGMSQETINGLFAKFERAKNANEVNVTGTGLGLYVAKKMAEEMGGTIKAMSEGEGKGSTFRLTLPLQM